MKKTNSITRQQFWQLCEALKTCIFTLRENKLSLTKAAGLLSKHLEFKVTDDQVREASNLTKLTWDRPRSQGVTAYHGARRRLEEESKKLAEIGEQLMLTVAKQDERLRKIETLVSHLYGELNAKLPEFVELPRDSRLHINGSMSVGSGIEM